MDILFQYLPKYPLKLEEEVDIHRSDKHKEDDKGLEDDKQSDDYQSSPSSDDIDQVSIVSYNEEDGDKPLLKNDDLLLNCNIQLELARKMLETKQKLNEKDDKKIIRASKEVMHEIFPNLKFMINQILLKNSLDEMDRFDLEKLCKHLEELNNICITIYDKS